MRLYRAGLDESYRPLPSVYLALLSIWFVSACSWTFNTYKNRHFQVFMLLQSDMLSLDIIWGVLFQTAYFVSFLLISHGYCITYEHLSVTERRATAALGSIFYLTLVGYRASVPYFTVLLILNYLITFTLIFHQISQNLSVLRDQLTFIEDEDVQTMHDAVLTKYSMFKKFQSAMQVVVMAETVLDFQITRSGTSFFCYANRKIQGRNNGASHLQNCDQLVIRPRGTRLL
ncbi:hypothetical protein Tsubulata_038279 [Turnera subulata]|uniref:Uncharacterized protein n=1 Tax=Turnera subulata TaxID=218843 RepID=A0A9Q0FJU9_9ROSI|nr:hypothetical protein Tsubulata_038279 [Turnera subulata]